MARGTGAALPDSTARMLPWIIVSTSDRLRPLGAQLSGSASLGRGIIRGVAHGALFFADRNKTGFSARPEENAPPFRSHTRQSAWRRANLTKYAAHLAVSRALAQGRLERQVCEVCGHPRVDAHHDSYEDPVAVRWLCRRHHMGLHLYGEDMFPVGGTSPSLRRSSP